MAEGSRSWRWATLTPALLLAAGCGGGVRSSGDASVGDASISDGQPADAPWWSNFPDAWRDPDHPPAPGEEPSLLDAGCDSKLNGGAACWGGEGICDGLTGWCCSGHSIGGQTPSCVCGSTLGCVHPKACCAKPGETIPSCAPSLSDCYADGGLVWP